MNTLKIQVLYLILVIFLFSRCLRDNDKISHNQRVGIQPDGSILVPSNQLLRPAGFQVYLPGRPVDLVLTPDGKFLLVKNKDDLDLIRLSDRTVMQSLPFDKSGASLQGVCISPDGNRIYVTDAENRISVAGFNQDKIMEWKDPVIPGSFYRRFTCTRGSCSQ